MKSMTFFFILIVLLSCLSFYELQATIQSKKSNSSVDSTLKNNNDINHLKNEIEKLKNHQDSETMRRIELLMDIAEQHITRANRIIDWSAMFFAALTIILIIAGAVGLKQFSDIRKTEDQMKNIIDEMKIEIENIKKIKVENQSVLDALKQKIEKESKDIIKIMHLLNEGISSYYSGNLTNTILAFKNLKNIKPDDYESSCYLARAYSGQGKFNLAIEEAYNATKLSESPGQAFRIIGECYRRMHDFDKSIEALKKAISFDKDSSIFNSLGHSFLKKRDLENAEDAYRKSLEFERNASACVGIAVTLLMKENIQEAHKYFNEGILLSEERLAEGTISVWPYYTLMISHLALNNQEKCLFYLNKAIEKNKDPGIINEVINDYESFKDIGIPTDLLNRCLKILKNTIAEIQK